MPNSIASSTPVSVDSLRRARDRVRAISMQQSAMLDRFWRDGSFQSVHVEIDSTNDIFDALCVLSFADHGDEGAPRDFNVDQFVDARRLDSCDDDPSRPRGVFFSLVAVAAVAPERVASERFDTLVDAVHDHISTSRDGAIVLSGRSFPSGFASWWAARALSAWLDHASGRDADRDARALEAFRSIAAWSKREVQRQIAYNASGRLDRFDALQLAYALATDGLRCKRAGRLPDRHMVRHALDVIFAAQRVDGMWPKVIPISSVPSPVGDMYPFPFETVVSLLAVGTMPQTGRGVARGFRHEVFAHHLDALLSMLQWAESHAMYEAGELVGWRAAGTEPGPGPHPWATATVLSFARAFDGLLQQMIQEQILQSLKASQPASLPQHLAVRWESATMPQGSSPQGLLETVERYFIAPRRAPSSTQPPAWSAMLAGPPGTAKTTLAKGIARELGWPYLAIDPSDFLARGESMIASEARAIFRDLAALEHVVVLLDEGENLVRARTDDMPVATQMVTTSMLTLIQDLVDAKQVILLLATNFPDRIDAAARRVGRFDLLLQVGPPAIEPKLAHLQNQALHDGVAPEPVLSAANDHISTLERASYGEWVAISRELAGIARGGANTEDLGDLLERAGQGLALSAEEWREWQQPERGTFVRI